MGKDVFGTERYQCSVSGCACQAYICVIDTMTDEERAMTVVHHPRNHPGYTTCSCGHGVTDHADRLVGTYPLAAQGELRKCTTCSSRTGACKLPGEEGHLLWSEAYCPKCFTKPNPKGCKNVDSVGHWTTAAAARAVAATSVAEEPESDLKGTLYTL